MNLNEINEDIYKRYPEHKEYEYWAGCNYYINQGANEWEPKGTATSMHECEGCERLQYCPSKKTSPVWEFSKTIEFEMTLKWNEMIEKERPKQVKREP